MKQTVDAKLEKKAFDFYNLHVRKQEYRSKEWCEAMLVCADMWEDAGNISMQLWCRDWVGPRNGL